MERVSLKYSRRIQPKRLIPPSLLRGYYNNDPLTLIEVRKWVNKNGLTILFTLGEAYGNETVWLDSDGHLYMGTNKIPNIDWLRKKLLELDPQTLKKCLSEKWTRKKMFEELKKRSPLV
jgi:hypothetical protein